MDDGLDGIGTLKQVLAMAEEHRWQLTLFAVAESIGSSSRMLVTCLSPDDLKARILRNRLAQLEALISMIRHDACRLQARAAFGNRAKEIAREDADGQYDLLIKRYENNSTDKKLLKNCKSPVWLLKPGDFTKSAEIVGAKLPQIAVEKPI